MARSLTQKEQSDLTLKDVLPLTIGVRKSDGTIAPLFKHGTLLPSKAQRTLPTVRDMQTSIVLHLYQGNDVLAQNNDSIQVFIFSQLRPALKGKTKVEALFTLNEDGMLSVQARDKATKRKVRLQALSVAQFEALKHTSPPLPPPPKEEPPPKKPTPAVVDKDLMISQPFPAQIPIEPPPPTQKTVKRPPNREKKPQTEIKSNSVVENKKIPIKNSKTISVPKSPSLLTRCIRWFFSLLGRS